MSAIPDQDRYKAELDGLIASGLFAKAPSLALLLDYVCTKYFEGEANQIKEYNIAVEALGRPPSFDPRQDSIVRVEAFRLRKRLKQYYENGGATRPLRIVIPSGQYVPQFLENGGHGEPHHHGAELAAVTPTTREIPPSAPGRELAIAAVPLTVPLTIDAPVLVRPATPGWVRTALFLAVPLLVAAAAATIWYVRMHAAAKGVATEKSASMVAGVEQDEVRILCGSTDTRHVDRAGNVWSGDRYFRGGSIFSTPGHPVFRTTDPELFRHRREGDFSYDIPLKPGVYELHLHFAETLFGENNTAGGGEGSRVFRISINGKALVWAFDALSDAGGSNTADERVFKDLSPAADGALHVQFAGLLNNVPFLNALEVMPGIPGKMRPVRIVVRSRNYTDSHGLVWGADRFFSHGSAVPRSEPVTNTSDPEMFQGERFGNFKYAIPVAEGRYKVTLRFAEGWFGPGNPGGGGAGSRLFDVYCNGTALLRNFDLLRAAGGPLRATEKTFHGIVPNAQGKIELAFVPVINYACVNAIEVMDDSS